MPDQATFTAQSTDAGVEYTFAGHAAQLKRLAKVAFNMAASVDDLTDDHLAASLNTSLTLTLTETTGADEGGAYTQDNLEVTEEATLLDAAIHVLAFLGLGDEAGGL